MKLIIMLLYLLTASIIDIKSRKIPLIFFITSGIALSIIKIFFIKGELDIFAFIPGLILILISIISHNALGIGDGILILTFGILLNMYEILCITLFAFFFVSIVGIFVFIKNRNKNQQLPFIPFLFLALVFTNII